MTGLVQLAGIYAARGLSYWVFNPNYAADNIRNPHPALLHLLGIKI